MPGRFLTVVDDERATFRIEFFRGLAFLHLTVKLPVKAMRDAKRIFPQIKAWLKSVGHEVVYVLIPEGDEKLYRFEQFFGFREVKRRRGHILMIQRC
jgi:hypothetical protein